VKGLLTRLYVRVTEWHRGQTMAEYALIMAAIAVVCLIAYQTLGTGISTTATQVANDLP
jgi:Flp pilus assembly pilin Flp